MAARRQTDPKLSEALAWVGQCPAHIRSLTAKFAALAAGVVDERWSGPSSCADWSIAELVAHGAFGAAYYAQAIDDALRGTVKPLWSGGGAEAHAQQRKLMRSTPAEGVEILQDRCGQLDAVLEQVSDGELSLDAWHMRGPRPVWMYVAMRVYELGLHLWDLQTSIGLPGSLSREVAQPLVDLLLTGILPQTIDAEAAKGVAADIAVDCGDRRRLVRLANGALRAGNLGQSQATITIPPEGLVLAMTGRIPWPGEAIFEGDAIVGRAFASFFRVW
jgi:uncharacterized protein (TIGR03083 family)